MTLLRNLALFFVLFLPATCATGLAGDFFVGPQPPPRFAYVLATYALGVLPLLVPSALAVPVLHFAYRALLPQRPPSRARGVVAVATPAGLLAAHLLVFGADFWSAPLLALFAVPGVLYGLAFRVPRPAGVGG